jgi:superfamily II DNA/RNA helicase
VPSRELAIQIEQVVREMGSGFKANAVYGGRSGHKDRSELKHAPTILIGTPGRVADHLRNGTIDSSHIRTLVLDEFDKSLEVGFAEEMSEIIQSLRSLSKKVLTSATEKVEIPSFVGIRNATRLDFLKGSGPQLQVKVVVSPDKEKLGTLVELLKHLANKNGIVFCNLKDSIQSVSLALDKGGIDHGCFYGGLEQLDRERALIKFRNGTNRVLVSTDLAARGIDVPEMDFIIHYQLPYSEDEFVHRNGRTARMKSEGTAFVLRWKQEKLPPFIRKAQEFTPDSASESSSVKWETIYISGGRKDKISKGDIAGLFFKQGGLSKNELGIIELKQDCSYVSVPKAKSKQLIGALNNSRLKKKKVRISLLK